MSVMNAGYSSEIIHIPLGNVTVSACSYCVCNKAPAFNLTKPNIIIRSAYAYYIA